MKDYDAVAAFFWLFLMPEASLPRGLNLSINANNAK